MFLKDPYTGKPSLAFTLYALECEGELEPKEKKEEENEDDEPLCQRPTE